MKLVPHLAALVLIGSTLAACGMAETGAATAAQAEAAAEAAKEGEKMKQKVEQDIAAAQEQAAAARRAMDE